MAKPHPTPEGIEPLGHEDARALLTGIIDRAQKLTQKAILVFDLDSTLLDNRPRQARILREYGELHRIQALAGSDPDHWEGWDMRIAMRNAGLSEALIEEHYEPYRDFWREHFFTSKYCADDIPLPGAPGYVQAGVSTGAQIFYVTGRWEGMRAGTLQSFRTPEIPLPDDKNVQLLMKPALAEDDDVFKDRAYLALREAGTVIAAFDNEPTHINGYRQAFPDATSVHMATDHSLRGVKVRDDIPSIRDFSPYES